MARGLSDKTIPLLVNGSIDTKTNPKLVQPGSLLELENLYQLRTGEMRVRNGFATLPATNSLGVADNLFVTANGGLGTIGRSWNALTTYPQALKYGNSGTTGWSPESSSPSTLPTLPHPFYTAQVSGVTQGLQVGVTSAPTVDPDLIEQLGFRLVVWTDGSTAITKFDDAREIGTGRASNRWNIATASAKKASMPTKVAAAGSNQSAVFFASGANNLKAIGFTSAGTTSTGEINIAADLDATGFFDAKGIPGTGNVAVAYRVTGGGGVKCGIFNPSTGTFTAVVATAAADATLTLGWLDDQFTTGNLFLATAGTVSGVVVRTMAAGTMVVSATNIIDATATANVRNVTGHLTSSTGPQYSVLWDVTAAASIDDVVKLGTWNGGATVTQLANGQSLYSRSAKFADGNYHVLLVFSSAVQGSYQLVPCDLTGASPTMAPECVVLSGEAAGRRLTASLATPLLSSGAVNVAVVRNRKITTPTGTVTGGSFLTAAMLTFTQMAKVTHARELGGTVFIPGGIIFRDDGGTMEPATFPFYPEAPTGGSSAAGGAMTATGSYSYRTVRKAIDATGRITRSAGSIPFAITLGAGDNRVTLTVDNTAPPVRGPALNAGHGFGTVFTEIYRRGPAATGATLYNKVGEVANSGAITFIDTMSDVTAALGEVAYFNGNVLENFSPPATALLEVNGNRVGLVNAEDPTEFWYSKEYKAGTGIGFNPLNKVAISGDGAGGMTALGAMDGRWILFKKSAIYVLSGDGPNDLGQGSFNAPQAVSRILGTTNPSSVVETPDGLMFQAQTGDFWLLGRGLDLTYIGAPIEAFTHGFPTLVTGAAVATNLPTVRFTTTVNSPKAQVFEWDYFHKKWYVHYFATNDDQIVDCANSPVFGWCMLLQSGTLIKETEGQATDTFISNAIIPKVSFPHLQFAGLSGYQRLRSLDFTIDVMGNHTLSVDGEYNFSGAVTGTPKTIVLTTVNPTAQVSYNPPDGRAKCTSVRPVLTISGAPAGATFRLTGATATIAVKRGSNITAPSRMT